MIYISITMENHDHEPSWQQQKIRLQGSACRIRLQQTIDDDDDSDDDNDDNGDDNDDDDDNNDDDNDDDDHDTGDEDDDLYLQPPCLLVRTRLLLEMSAPVTCVTSLS